MQTHDALLTQRHDTVPDPYAPAAHLIGQHHVRGETIADDGKLMRTGDARLGMCPEVRHDLIAAPRFLDLVRQDRDASGRFDLRGKDPLGVVAQSAGRVGDYQEAAAGVCRPQLLEVVLGIFRETRKDEMLKQDPTL